MAGFGNISNIIHVIQFVYGIILLCSTLKGFTKRMLYQAFIMTSIFMLVSVSSYFVHELLALYVNNTLVSLAVVFLWVVFSEIVLVLIFQIEEASFIKHFFKSIYKRALNG